MPSKRSANPARTSILKQVKRKNEPGLQHLSGCVVDDEPDDSDVDRDRSLAAENEDLRRQLRALKTLQKSRHDLEWLQSSKGMTLAAAKSVDCSLVKPSENDDVDGSSISDSDEEEVELLQTDKRQ
eukprot:2930065-Rhodomonas_salina.1